jgi:phospholipase/carboxylesterase
MPARQMMGSELPDAVEIQTGERPTAALIWLHGLGADGHDFEPVVPELARGVGALRVVLPHAPVRPVTLNGGARMRAWYDIVGLDRHSEQDETGVHASDAAVRALIQREEQRGICADRVVLGGFSQGGALALFSGTRYPQRLAGLVGLSCYLLLAGSFDAASSAANAATPVFLAHGTDDPIVDPGFGRETRSVLESAGHAVEWHSYPMGHAVCAEEIAAIAAFLRRVLPPLPPPR